MKCTIKIIVILLLVSITGCSSSKKDSFSEIKKVDLTVIEKQITNLQKQLDTNTLLIEKLTKKIETLESYTEWPGDQQYKSNYTNLSDIEKKIKKDFNTESQPKIKQEYLFKDISNSKFAKYINDIAEIGTVFEKNKGNFEPNENITRAEYINWLIKMNNSIVNRSSNTFIQILQDQGEGQYEDVYDFPDLKNQIYTLNTVNRLFPNKSKNFLPSKTLTREELIAFKTYFEKSNDPKPLNKNIEMIDEILSNKFTDTATIDEQYKASILEAIKAGDLISRVFGNSDKLYPKKLVSREEAAASIWEIKGLTASKVLNIRGAKNLSTE